MRSADIQPGLRRRLHADTPVFGSGSLLWLQGGRPRSAAPDMGYGIPDLPNHPSADSLFTYRYCVGDFFLPNTFTQPTCWFCFLILHLKISTIVDNAVRLFTAHRSHIPKSEINIRQRQLTLQAAKMLAPSEGSERAVRAIYVIVIDLNFIFIMLARQGTIGFAGGCHAVGTGFCHARVADEGVGNT